MKRDYQTGVAEDVVFFKGIEVEHTPAHNMMTLFVTGIQDITEIEQRLVHSQFELPIDHIFFGANHSYKPSTFDEWTAWEQMIEHFLKQDYLCTLDIPLMCAEQFLQGPLVEYDNFIPQLRVAIPYIKQYNYNTMIKIDDKDFKASNPGVWCHRLHDLLDTNVFTPWDKYKSDEVLK